MKKISCASLLLLLVFAIMAVGCGTTSVNELELTTKKLYEFYPGDISNVDSIQITDGSTGESKSFTNKQQVQEWINQVKDIEFVPDPIQEDRSGFLFSVSLFEGQDKKLTFTPNSLGGHYYIYNEDLKKRIQEFFVSADSTYN